ncbi:MAG: hypothetical protein AB7F86_13045 [Bdellovibrionales bacterium]
MEPKVPSKKPQKDPKLPIDESDITDFILAKSDFSFEAKVSNRLSLCGFKVDHAGTYIDTVTKKIRQFDIKAYRDLGDDCYAFLSVECKNLKPQGPLVIHRLKRKSGEAFHDLVYFPPANPIKDDGILIKKKVRSSAFVLRLEGQQSIYSKGDFVGKAMDVLRRGNAGILGGDGEVFEKQTQSLSSAMSFLEDISTFTPGTRAGFFAIFPFLVIPDDSLWVIDYGDNGETLGKPVKKDTAKFYIDRAGNPNFRGDNQVFRFSHMDIVTIGALPKLLDEYFYLTQKNDNGYPLAFGESSVRTTAAEKAVLPKS